RIHISLTAPGMRSRLPCSCGTQREWITSADRVLIRTGRPTGMCSSLAVRRRRAGMVSSYSVSHHHWCPVTTMLSAPSCGHAPDRTRRREVRRQEDEQQDDGADRRTANEDAEPALGHF